MHFEPTRAEHEQPEPLQAESALRAQLQAKEAELAAAREEVTDLRYQLNPEKFVRITPGYERQLRDDAKQGWQLYAYRSQQAEKLKLHNALLEGRLAGQPPQLPVQEALLWHPANTQELQYEVGLLEDALAFREMQLELAQTDLFSHKEQLLAARNTLTSRELQLTLANNELALQEKISQEAQEAEAAWRAELEAAQQTIKSLEATVSNLGSRLAKQGGHLVQAHQDKFTAMGAQRQAEAERDAAKKQRGKSNQQPAADQARIDRLEKELASLKTANQGLLKLNKTLLDRLPK